MADAAPVVHIGENSPEEVAYKLMFSVANAEGKQFTAHAGMHYIAKGADRKWLLDTYAECLEAVSGRRSWDGPTNFTMNIHD